MNGFRRFFACFMLIFTVSLVSGPVVFGADTRTGALDMFIVIDGSASLSSGRDDAVRWLCDYAIEGILREGDRLTVWLAAASAKEIYSSTLSGADSKEAVKNLIRGLQPQGVSADYEGALRAAAASGTAYTLIISGSRAGSASFPGGEETAALLRYSRVQEFAGWRATTASLGIGSRVRRAAAAFMN
jgi:hypothetical protein